MTLLEQYAELKRQEKEIGEQLKVINEKLLKHMIEQQLSKIETDYGTLSKAKKFVYTYSDEYKEEDKKAKEYLKELKVKEEQNQEPSVTEYLTFRAKI